MALDVEKLRKMTPGPSVPAPQRSLIGRSGFFFSSTIGENFKLAAAGIKFQAAD